MTCQPNGPWVEQQARNLVYDLAERGEKASYLIKDGDKKFTATFDELFRSEGIKVKKLPPASPNLDAFAERFVQTIKNECVDQFVVFGERHLEYLIREYEDYYNTVRPHQGIENRTIGTTMLFPHLVHPILRKSSATPNWAAFCGIITEKLPKTGTHSPDFRMLYPADFK